MTAEPDKKISRVEELHLSAVALMKEARWDEALKVYEECVNLNPFMPATLINLANCWDALGHWGRAINALERALALQPNLPEGYVNLSAIYHKMDHTGSALAAADKALSLEPFNKGHRWNRAVFNLSLGNLKQGWTDYDARYWRPFARDHRRSEPPPYWHGEPFPAGSLIHVWAEQGLGEVVLYTQMVMDLARMKDASGGYVRVVYEIPDGLVDVIEYSMRVEYPNVTVIGHNHKGKFKPTHQLPIGNLGKIFRKDWRQFKGAAHLKVPPLQQANPGAVRYTFGKDGQIMAPDNVVIEQRKPRIGLSWMSNNDEIGRGKSMSLMDLRPILEIPGVDIINLQYGDVREEVAAASIELGINIDVEDDDYHCKDNNKPMLPFFRRVASCDYVVTISNFTAHAAASIGTRALIMLPRGQPCLWHWFKTRNDSPWYDAAVLYRQLLPPHHARPWFEDVIPQVASDLRRNLFERPPK